MKRLLTIILFVSLLLPVMGQGRSGLQIGLQGAVNTRFDNDRFAMGEGGALDINYIYLTPISRNAQLGLHLGVGADFAQTVLQRRIGTETDVMTYSAQADGSMITLPVHYTLSADARYNDRQLALTVPLMLALRANGVAVDLGVKLFFPVYDTYALTLQSGEVDAYLTSYGVHIQNDPTMGVFPASQSAMTGSGTAPRCSLSLGAAIGYEWYLGRQNAPRAYSHYASAATERRLSLQLVAEYPVWQNSTFTLPPIAIASSAISLPSIPLPELSKPLTIGIRLAYTLFPSTQRSRFPCSCSR